MDAFVEWLKATALSQGIVRHTWIWPVCETIHFVGLALLLGTVGFLDLRLMGFMKPVPVRAARALMPFALAGFILNLSTGVIFLIGLPEQYVHNRAWWTKVSFLVLAGINAFLFETTLAARAVTIGPGDATPWSAKIIGAVSLVSWLGVLYWGRMLPFIGNAY
jgi:uncharacterized protein DUF6644